MNMFVVNLLNINDVSKADVAVDGPTHLLMLLIEEIKRRQCPIERYGLEDVLSLVACPMTPPELLQQAVLNIKGRPPGAGTVILRAFRLSSIGQRVVSRAGDVCKTQACQDLARSQAERLEVGLTKLRTDNITTIHDHMPTLTPLIELTHFLDKSQDHKPLCDEFWAYLSTAGGHTTRYIVAVAQKLVCEAQSPHT